MQEPLPAGTRFGYIGVNPRRQNIFTGKTHKPRTKKTKASNQKVNEHLKPRIAQLGGIIYRTGLLSLVRVLDHRGLINVISGAETVEKSLRKRGLLIYFPLALSWPPCRNVLREAGGYCIRHCVPKRQARPFENTIPYAPPPERLPPHSAAETQPCQLLLLTLTLTSSTKPAQPNPKSSAELQCPIIICLRDNKG